MSLKFLKSSSNQKQALVLLLLIIGVIFLFLSLITTNLHRYQEKFNFKKLEVLYHSSQFAEKPENRKQIIQDEDLYAYSGWQYLTRGEIDQINVEHPPLGKYLIGLSILLFKNQNIGQIIWGIIFLTLLYRLSFKIVKNAPLSLLLVLIFFQEKIFQEQLTHSLLDLSQGVFLLIFFLLIIKKNKKRCHLIVQGLSLGIIASIKYPSTALIAFLTLTAFLIIKKEKEIIKKLSLIGLAAFFVFLLSYLPFLIKNPNPSSFYSLQVRALKIHLSHVPEYPKGQVLNVLFLNRWLSWWGEKKYLKTEFWNIFWPILTLSFLISLYKWRQKLKDNLLINLWSIFYLISLGSRLFFPRYLFLLIPFFYLHLGYSIKKLMINGSGEKSKIY